MSLRGKDFEGKLHRLNGLVAQMINGYKHGQVDACLFVKELQELDELTKAMRQSASKQGTLSRLYDKYFNEGVDFR